MGAQDVLNANDGGRAGNFQEALLFSNECSETGG